MIDIQQLIEADRNLLLALNGSHSLFWDGFMWVVDQYGNLGSCSNYLAVCYI